MKKTALIYWPKKGNVENTAAKIAALFGEGNIDVFTISSVDTAKLKDYGLLIFGGSTIGADNWEDTHTTKWYNFFAEVKKLDLSGKLGAIYGLGDQILYPEHFVDGMATIRDELSPTGIDFIGAWPTEGYEHTDSKSVEGEYFIGLALDDDQQPELSEDRIAKWVETLQARL
ncbi:MAG TPA: flavodoxin [Bacteroidales bacterium]|nr:flavodoxin [Bacteroidales bacterium]